jgi:hypothetical protein
MLRMSRWRRHKRVQVLALSVSLSSTVQPVQVQPEMYRRRYRHPECLLSELEGGTAAVLAGKFSTSELACAACLASADKQRVYRASVHYRVHLTQLIVVSSSSSGEN